uniref:Lymphocyte antigen 86 n=1 Tax=Nothoprocta perdicaria TaxID=30464 RepID=A0A8C6ZKB8_NOTPE
MKASNILVLILLLLCINASTEWPTHTVCKESNLEIYYKSCAGQHGSNTVTAAYKKAMNRRAILKRHSIKRLYAKIKLIINGKTVLSYSEPLCEPDDPKLIFCGKKKGEHIYYEGPVTLGIKEIPQGEYTISAVLTNEDGLTVACADFNVKNYLDYY